MFITGFRIIYFFTVTGTKKKSFEQTCPRQWFLFFPLSLLFSFVKQLELLWCIQGHSSYPCLLYIGRAIKQVILSLNWGADLISGNICAVWFSILYPKHQFFDNIINFASLHFNLHWDDSIGICCFSGMHNF